MWKVISPDKMLSLGFLGMTAVTGLIDAVSFLSLGHVFTANMTGNVVFLAFASAGVSELSVPRSFTALLGFLLGAVLGGRIMALRLGSHRFGLPWSRLEWKSHFCSPRRSVRLATTPLILLAPFSCML